VDSDPHLFGRLDPDPQWKYGSGSRRAKMIIKTPDLDSSVYEQKMLDPDLDPH
jgi:hypothetical protein